MLTNSKPPSDLEARVPAISEYVWVETLILRARVQDYTLGRTGRMCLRRRRAWRQPRGQRPLTQITNSMHFEGNRKQKDSISVTEAFHPLLDPLNLDNLATQISTHLFHHAHPIRHPSHPLTTTAGNRSKETVEQSLVSHPTLAFHEITRQGLCRRLSLL